MESSLLLFLLIIHFTNIGNQNSRQKVLNKGLTYVQGWQHSEKLIKTPRIYSGSYFNLWGLELCLGGIKPPCRELINRNVEDTREFVTINILTETL